MKKLDQLNMDIEEALSASSSPSDTPCTTRRQPISDKGFHQVSSRVSLMLLFIYIWAPHRDLYYFGKIHGNVFVSRGLWEKPSSRRRTANIHTSEKLSCVLLCSGFDPKLTSCSRKAKSASVLMCRRFVDGVNMEAGKCHGQGKQQTMTSAWITKSRVCIIKS